MQLVLSKNVVAADLADECTIQLSYAIGVSKPLSVYVNTNGTNKVDEQKIEKSVQDLFDLSPRGIREHLKLTNAIYVPTSAYGILVESQVTRAFYLGKNRLS